MKDVFLAHNSKDKSLVIELQKQLELHGVSTWLDCDEIPPGRLFQDEIQKAISCVKAAAIIIGADGLGRWQTVELHTIISQSVEKGIPVIPILLPGVDGIPTNLYFLKEFHHVKFQERIDECEQIGKLLWGIKNVKIEKELPQESMFVKMRIKDIIIDRMKKDNIDLSGILSRNDVDCKTIIRRYCSKFPETNQEDFKKKLLQARSYAYDMKYSSRENNEDERYIDFDSWESEIRILLKKLGILTCKNLDVINVGIGNGLENPNLYDDFENLYGIDISGESLVKAKKVLPKINAIQANAEDLHMIPSSSMDLYISLRTFQSSLFNKEEAIQEAYRVLRSGGIFIISISNAHKAKNGIIQGILKASGSEVDFDLPYNITDYVRKNITRLDFYNVGIYTGNYEVYVYGIKTS